MASSAPIPFLTDIQGGLSPGMVILIAGIILPNAKRFEINLQTGGGKYLSNDIALHFNPRFREDIVRDTLLHGKWVRQQRDGGNPLACADTYVIRLVVEAHAYKIYINGVYFCDYVHIISIQEVTHLGILGDTSLTMVGFEWPSKKVPYIPKIPGGLHTGMELEVAGVINFNAQRFQIDLQCGDGDFLSQDIALHIKQILPNGGIVLNHYQCKNWGFEDIFSISLMSVSQPFRIQVLTEVRGYKIFINDRYFTDYHHRLQPWRVTRLGIHGDIYLTRVTFSWNVQKKPDTARLPSGQLQSSSDCLPDPCQPPSVSYRVGSEKKKITFQTRSGQTNDTFFDIHTTTPPPQLAEIAPQLVESPLQAVQASRSGQTKDTFLDIHTTTPPPQLAESAPQLVESLLQLANRVLQAFGSPTQLADSAPKLTDNSSQLTDNSSQLADIASQLAGSSPQFVNSSLQLASREQLPDSAPLVDSASKLTDNSSQLADRATKPVGPSPQLINSSLQLASRASIPDGSSTQLTDRASQLPDSAPLTDSATKPTDSAPQLADGASENHNPGTDDT